MTRSKKRKSNKLFLGVLLALTAALTANLIKQECEIRNLEEEKLAVQQRIVLLKEQQSSLESERRLLDNPRYIEKLAREEYNMVGKDEIPLFVVEEKTK